MIRSVLLLLVEVEVLAGVAVDVHGQGIIVITTEHDNCSLEKKTMNRRWLYILVPILILAEVLLSGCKSLSDCPHVEEHRGISFDISPDGKKIVFTAKGTGCRDLYLLDLETSQVVRVAETDMLEADPRFCPDGQHIVYSARPKAKNPKSAWHLFMCTIDGKDIKQLTHDLGVADRKPVPLPPDGNRFVFWRSHRLRRGHMGGVVWDDTKKYLLSGGTVKLFPWYVLSFSPDGTRVVAVGEAIADPNWQGTESRSLAIAPFDPKKAEVASHSILMIPIGALYQPESWSPDGQKVAFISDRNKRFEYEIWLLDIQTGKVEQLTHLGTYTECARFHPAGDRILFLAMPKNKEGFLFELYEVDIRTKQTRRVADYTLFDDPLNWKQP